MIPSQHPYISNSGMVLRHGAMPSQMVEITSPPLTPHSNDETDWVAPLSDETVSLAHELLRTAELLVGRINAYDQQQDPQVQAALIAISKDTHLVALQLTGKLLGSSPREEHG